MNHDEAMKDWKLIGLDDTNEEGIVEQLGVNMNIALTAQFDKYEKNDPEPDSFIYIVINNEVHPFITGGPQVQALDDFIHSLIREQDYDI